MSSMVERIVESSTQGDTAVGQQQDITPLAQLLSVATTILQQAVDLVDNVLTDDEQLTVQSQYLPGSTIGKHLRHARDHFVLLCNAITSPSPHILSYDVRSRNTPMESKRQDAREALKETIALLEDVVPRAQLETGMTLNAVTPHMQILETSFGRELWFASLHAVHHWSMVRVIAGEINIKLAGDFGFAPSTLLYKGLQEKAKI